MYVLGLLFFTTGVFCDGYYEVPNFQYHFPSGSGMGIYAALALPVPESLNIDLFYAVFFEAYYALPYNETSFEYPPSVDSSRDMDRQTLYESIEHKIASNGHPGKSCLLKSICEVSAFTTLHHNGVVGDLIHLIFTPSSTLNTNSSFFVDYSLAEETGRNFNECQQYACELGLMDLISFVE